MFAKETFSSEYGTHSPPHISQYIKLFAFGLAPNEPRARVRPLSLKSFTQNPLPPPRNQMRSHTHTRTHISRDFYAYAPRTHHAAAAGGSVGSLLHTSCGAGTRTMQMQTPAPSSSLPLPPPPPQSYPRTEEVLHCVCVCSLRSRKIKPVP